MPIRHRSLTPAEVLYETVQRCCSYALNSRHEAIQVPCARAQSKLLGFAIERSAPRDDVGRESHPMTTLKTERMKRDGPVEARPSQCVRSADDFALLEHERDFLEGIVEAIGAMHGIALDILGEFLADGAGRGIGRSSRTSLRS